MNYMLVWADFYKAGELGNTTFVRQIIDELPKENLLLIIAGVVGVTISYTLIWRFAGYIRNVVTGGITNSKRRR